MPGNKQAITEHALLSHLRFVEPFSALENATLQGMLAQTCQVTTVRGVRGRIRYSWRGGARAYIHLTTPAMRGQQSASGTDDADTYLEEAEALERLLTAVDAFAGGGVLFIQLTSGAAASSAVLGASARVLSSSVACASRARLSRASMRSGATSRAQASPRVQSPKHVLHHPRPASGSRGVVQV